MVKLIGYKNLLSFMVTKRGNLGKKVVGWGKVINLRGKLCRFGSMYGSVGGLRGS